jgi:tetratricopeptide (TPR) repeat protein
VPPAQASAAADQARRASALARQGLLDEALREFDRAIATNPRLTLAYLGAGDIHRQRGDFAQAEQRYGAAARIEPQSFDAQYLHGLSLQMLNRLADAVGAYLRALTIRPDDFNANLNLAIAYLQLGEPSQALVYGQRAVGLNPTSAEARTNLGAVYAALERHEEAIVEYQQAAELAPLKPPLLLNLAESLGKTERFTEMVNVLEQVVRTEPTPVAYERLGAGLFRLRRYEESVGAFRKAVEIDPNHYPALNGVGVNMLNAWVWSEGKDEGAREEGLRALRRSLQVEPRQPRIIDLVNRYARGG